MTELKNYKKKPDSDGLFYKPLLNPPLTDSQLSTKNNSETKLSYKVTETLTTTQTPHTYQ